MFKLVSRSRSLLEGQGGGLPAPAAKASVTPDPRHGGPGGVSDGPILRSISYNGPVALLADDSTCKSAHRYASRPLPLPPPLNSSMAERPSTSGGLSSKKSGKSDFNFNNKRVSRDDFYLETKSYGRSRAKTFGPSQGQLQTPDASPRSVSTARFANATTVRKPSLDLLNVARHEDIGMALGSPSHAPAGPITWRTNTLQHGQDASPYVEAPVSRSSSVDTFDMPVQRKPGKWRLFGMFGRKHSDQSVPAISISDPNGLKHANPAEGQAAKAIEPQPEVKSPARSNTSASRKTPRHKPIVVRSQTMPLGMSNHEPPKETTRKKDVKFESIPIALDTGPTVNSTPGPLLNVEIPDVRMERYSVMFNSVLNSNPSLLTRRQANVQKLKPIEDVNEHNEEHPRPTVPRRATSPGLALFPTDRKARHIAPKLSPRHRTNSSPALLSSPSQPSFDHSVHNHPRRPSRDEASGHARIQTRGPSHDSHKKEPHTTAERPRPEPTANHQFHAEPHHFNPEESSLILESPTYYSDSEQSPTTVRSHALKPAAQYIAPSPKWQMMSPAQKTPSTATSQKTPSTAASSTSSATSVSNNSYRKRSPSVASSAQAAITRHTQDHDDATMLGVGVEKTSALKLTPVEISIARQISISQQQRKMLQPLRTKSSRDGSGGVSRSENRSGSVSGQSQTARASPARTSPVAGVAMGNSGRIAETKTSTPTLVHPPESLSVKMDARQRRSQVAVVEEN
ncbi:hypothetical protein GGR57DRAFT_101090 [Xylariaceae sp. FL1272]|nr:hypothetical protein GGR57DRAFT_101090 [Xylariaceae sp. FL1272]